MGWIAVLQWADACLYIGGNAGIGSSLTHVHFTTSTQGDQNINGTGFAGGGEAGYNYLLWQKYLIGVEGDFGALALNHTLTDWNDVFPPADLILLSQKTSWYGTLRGRIGIGVFSPLPAFPAEFKERFVIVRFGLNYAFN